MLTKERKRQKQFSRGALRKGHSKNMQQIHRRTPMPKHDLNKTALQLHETMPQEGSPTQIHCILIEHSPQEHLWMAASEEREVSKSIYKKFYIKVYENLLE